MSDGGGVTARRALTLDNDLFFAVKITETLKRAGFQTRVTRTAMEFASLLVDGDYAVALVNTAARGVDWQAGVRSAREANIPVIAYGSHVDLETQAAARQAGATRVIANSRLAELAAIVERAIARAAGTTPQAEGGDPASPGAVGDEERQD